MQGTSRGVLRQPWSRREYRKTRRGVVLRSVGVLGFVNGLGLNRADARGGSPVWPDEARKRMRSDGDG